MSFSFIVLISFCIVLISRVVGGREDYGGGPSENRRFQVTRKPKISVSESYYKVSVFFVTFWECTGSIS